MMWLIEHSQLLGVWDPKWLRNFTCLRNCFNKTIPRCVEGLYVSSSPLYWVSVIFCFYASLRRREGILLCTCRSGGLSVTFSFLINYSRGPWHTFLKLCPHIRPGQQRNPIDFGITGSKVNTVTDCLSKDFPNELLLHTLVQLILNWLIQFYKTSVTKKSLGGIMFYKHLLLLLLCLLLFLYIMCVLQFIHLISKSRPK